MLAWSPLLIQKIEIHALGFVLRKLQLNRHRDTEVAPHAHAYAQLILYLTGEGVQTIGRRARIARAGDLFLIPARLPHGFAVAGRSRPLCLVLDYEVDRTARVRGVHRHLPAATLGELHALLARLPRKGRLTLDHYPAVLAVVARLLRPAPAAPETSTPPGLYERVEPHLRTAAPLSTIAQNLGYHPDHLNRKLKREAGVGLRELRHRLRLAAAQNALRTQPSIAAAAQAAGFEDPNYFTRWFRQQTGKPPSAWRQ